MSTLDSVRTGLILIANRVFELRFKIVTKKIGFFGLHLLDTTEIYKTISLYKDLNYKRIKMVKILKNLENCYQILNLRIFF